MGGWNLQMGGKAAVCFLIFAAAGTFAFSTPKPAPPKRPAHPKAPSKALVLVQHQKSAKALLLKHQIAATARNTTEQKKHKGQLLMQARRQFALHHLQERRGEMLRILATQTPTTDPNAPIDPDAPTDPSQPVEPAIVEPTVVEPQIVDPLAPDPTQSSTP